MLETTLQKPLTKITERLEMLQGELRVRAHLAGMEAREAWDRAHIERITDELSTLSEEAKLQLNLASMDARQAWGQIQSRIVELKGRFGSSADSLISDLGHAVDEIVRGLKTGVEKITAAGSKSLPHDQAR